MTPSRKHSDCNPRTLHVRLWPHESCAPCGPVFLVLYRWMVRSNQQACLHEAWMSSVTEKLVSLRCELGYRVRRTELRRRKRRLGTILRRVSSYSHSRVSPGTTRWGCWYRRLGHPSCQK